jgi:hypothetical protein
MPGTHFNKRMFFFHLSQNMRKHLAHLGLVHEYDYNPEISLKEKMVRYMLYLYIPGVELVYET